MNFNYETQGAITYLVCELDPADQLDTLTLGMLTNNHINGLAPVLYTEMDGQRFLKYNISAKVAVNQFFSGSMNKQRAMQAFQNILNALCSADEYMIDQNCFSVNPDHVFLNVSNCEAALICIPVDSSRNINAETASFFKQIVFSTQFDPNEDAGYITQMISYLNSGSDFTVYGFRDLVQSIASGATAPAQAAPQMQQQTPPQQSRSAVPPVSSFDSTISIDDMPASMGGRQHMPVNQGAAVVNQQPVQPQPQIRRPVPVQPAQINNPVQPQVQQQPQAQRPVQTPDPNVQKPPVQSNPGFAIPGQTPSFAVPGQNNVGAKQTPVQQTPQAQQSVQQAITEQGEKKMSFFSLMMHYNKENAAIYKAQKGTGKSKEKPAKQPKVHKTPKAQPATPPAVPQQDYSQQGTPANGVPAQQPFGGQQAGYRPSVQRIPVQNSFNETTVLSAIGGETTVLSEVATSNEPYLTRVKTGERIYINKPVFRIGKEKSYVDYFIADNTAISRSHCNIHSENGEYFIEDTNSTNHTYINGKIINSNVKVKLSSGDQVRLANENFTFSI